MKTRLNFAGATALTKAQMEVALSAVEGNVIRQERFTSYNVDLDAESVTAATQMAYLDRLLGYVLKLIPNKYHKKGCFI